jgi:heme/copper-type cytochrome/quinol oxidase subunit 2
MQKRSCLPRTIGLLAVFCLTLLPVIPASGEEEVAKGFILSTTLIVGVIIIAVIALFLFLRARLRK